MQTYQEQLSDFHLTQLKDFSTTQHKQAMVHAFELNDCTFVLLLLLLLLLVVVLLLNRSISEHYGN